MLIAGAMFCASCGGGNKYEGTADSEATEVAEETAEFTGDTFSKDAAEFYIKGFGLKFSDVEPGYEYDESEPRNFKGEARDVIAGFPTKDGAELSDEQFKEVVTKVYNATKAISETGICMYGYESKDKTSEAMAEKSLEEALQAQKIMGVTVRQTSWVYKLNGRLQIVTVDDISGTNGCYVRVSEALQKSLDETLDDAAKAIEEIDKDPNKKEIVDKALEEAGVK